MFGGFFKSKKKKSQGDSLDGFKDLLSKTFPGGEEQIKLETSHLHTRLNGKLSISDTKNLLVWTKTLIGISENKSLQHISDGIFRHENGRLSKDEAELVYRNITGIAENTPPSATYSLDNLFDAKTKYEIGLMYCSGNGVPQSYQEAMIWFRLAAQEGDADARFSLGDMYDNGEGVPKNDDEAIKWYRLAAEQGHADAQFNLGGMYENGKGVQQDNAEAAKWYELAADLGHADAQCSLGRMYDYGHGVPQDDKVALKWYRLAAEQGDADAQYTLGCTYENGEVVPQDYVEAMKWYQLAADQGDNNAQVGLKVLGEDLKALGIDWKK